jgi:hypothetical protein
MLLDTSVQFPDHSLDVALDDDVWLSRVCSQDVDRKQAFFGMSLANNCIMLMLIYECR